MRTYLAIFILAQLCTYPQEIPKVHFNHVYCVLDSADFRAISGSDFVNDTLCVHFTKPDYYGTYLFDPSSFLELFKGRKEKYLGFTGIAFSVDKIGELKILQDQLTKRYGSERSIDFQDSPPFYSLSVMRDSAFHANSRIYLWFMEYKPEYFEHNNLKISDSMLTRENYLEKYTATGAGMLLKKFTGVVLNLNPAEKEYLTGIFESIGYNKINNDHFVTPDDFRILIKKRLPGDRKALDSIEFESSQYYPEETTIRISENILVLLNENSGRIVIK